MLRLYYTLYVTNIQTQSRNKIYKFLENKLSKVAYQKRKKIHKLNKKYEKHLNGFFT